MAAEDAPLTLLTMTWRNLSRQPVRTVLTAFGVALGIVAIVSLGSIVRGLWVSVEGALHAGGGDMTVYEDGVVADFLSVLEEAPTRRRLEADPQVEAVAAAFGELSRVEGRPFTIVFGIYPHEFVFNMQQIVRGRPIEADDEVVIGAAAESNLGKTIGDTLLLRDRPFKITGVFSTGNPFFDGAIAMHIDTLRRLKGAEGKVVCFQIRLKPGADPYEVAERIERNYPELAAVVDAQQYHKVDSTLAIADSTVWAVSFLALVVGCIIVANTMWMSVHQRTREIGVLRAVGWSKRTIMLTVLIEAVAIGLFACLPGCLLGVGLAELTAYLPVTGQYVMPVFELKPFAQAIGVALLLSVLGSIVPALRAARISPVEALRYE